MSAPIITHFLRSNGRTRCGQKHAVHVTKDASEADCRRCCELLARDALVVDAQSGGRRGPYRDVTGAVWRSPRVLERMLGDDT